MTFNTSFGFFRFEPLRALRRFWVWATSPPACKEYVYSMVTGDLVQIRSLGDSELLIEIGYSRLPLHVRDSLRLEADRRRLPDELPQWARAARKHYPFARQMLLAERLFRP